MKRKITYFDIRSLIIYQNLKVLKVSNVFMKVPFSTKQSIFKTGFFKKNLVGLLGAQRLNSKVKKINK